ncbi:MAG: ubiquinol-cytochrome c chaperone [Hyphococcus sp.]|nr:MAG: ubiquinol-cytochrome c chaperone [Marinicaulis sp.]
MPFYRDLAVPDTLEGRFEMIAIHVFLILRRLKGEDAACKKVSQKLFDIMFQNMDDSLRELGVGDLVVGKKIRKLAENFFGRVGAYEEAMRKDAAENNLQALAKALGRNVYEDEAAPHAGDLATYVLSAVACIEKQPPARIAGGIIRFPDVGAQS